MGLVGRVGLEPTTQGVLRRARQAWAMGDAFA